MLHASAGPLTVGPPPVLRLFGDLLGYCAPEEVQGPVLPGAVPRGVAPAERSQTEHVIEGQAPKRSFEPIELPEVHAPSSKPIEVLPVEPEVVRPKIESLDVSAMPALDDTLLAQVRSAIKTNDVHTAVEALKGFSTFPSAALSGRELLWLGRAAASLDEDAVAHDALAAAAEATGHELDISRAKVMLAKLLDERLGRTADAAVWMERIVIEHPDSDAAVFARDWLKNHQST